MKNALQKLGPKVVFKYADGSTINVDVSAANGSFKYIRIFGLPPEVEDKQIATVMAKYGKIQQLVQERYPAETGFPILNGVRGVHMEVTAEIPAQIHIQHIKARIFYEGLQNKCFTCGALEHFKADCPKRKSVGERLTSIQSSIGTFASIVSNGLGQSVSYSPKMVVLNPKSTDESGTTEREAGNGEVPTLGGVASGEINTDLAKEESSTAVESGDVASGSRISRKDKGKKRDRKIMGDESGDTSESDVIGRKQHIIPAIGMNILSAQAQTVRQQGRETRSSSCVSSQRKQ